MAPRQEPNGHDRRPILKAVSQKGIAFSRYREKTVETRDEWR
jgi:hypothetical protein